jgi:hypothetical protein
MFELILDFLPWPGRSRDRTDEVVGKLLGGAITIRPRAADAIKRALSESGWVDGEVLAAGDLRQGKEPTILSMVTGLVLIELLRPRRSKSLPRHFVLAVTKDRVIAFGAVGGGDDSVDNGPYELSIRPDERGSWPRDSVRLTDLAEGSSSRSATLVLGGTERVPVWRSNPTRRDPSTDELLELLAN